MTEERPPSVFESAKVIRLLPGDVVLFRCPQNLSDPVRERVAELLNELFPAHESIILDGGQDVAVIRPEPGFIARLFRK